jgi:hypothetical protein
VCLALLDVNGDGILDAVVGTQDDNSLYLHLGQGSGGVGNGTFGPASLIATLEFSPTGIAVADFNADGLEDIAVAGGGASIAVLLGQGTTGVPNGTFAAPVSVSTGANTRGIIAYDWNDDGITDLAVSGGGIKLLYGNGSAGKGDGTFSLGPFYPANSTPNHLATADFNGDGIADFVVCNTGATTLNVYLGNGSGGVPDGTFTGGISVNTGTGPNTVAIADWDQDGRPDIAIASNNTGNSTSILLGLGNGTFDAPQTFATGGSNPAAIAVNDFNEDGMPDLLACNQVTQSVTRQLAGCPSFLSHALAIVSPNGGETWAGDSQHTITWNKGAGVMTVDLQRSDDSGSHWRTLARGLTGSSYRYTVTAPWTTHARFRVVEGHAAQFRDASDADFQTIDPALLAVGDPPAALALLGAQPNPARRSWPASLETSPWRPAGPVHPRPGPRVFPGAGTIPLAPRPRRCIYSFPRILIHPARTRLGATGVEDAVRPSDPPQGAANPRPCPAPAASPPSPRCSPVADSRARRSWSGRCRAAAST